ncbi:NAD(P)-dependent oxidoreductase [Dokdonella sp.]|uniref:NAD(P)-dependent oxidoreductase n=1 Tax=Dokdonella sp. TaxID=2291710 RepID=UPI001B196E89|nr:NAD(P)-dependent oxidoreductase [Dokdonella sp.]MBO9662996.1 NAD(P)-dependent oxidoreductase [Dokdonella sp.]
MNIALVGASGNAGSRILKELSDRGHAVTAIARQPEKIAALPGVTAKAGDVFDQAGLTALLRGHDVVVSAVHFVASDPCILIDAVKAAGAKRYLVVGGAGSLEVAPGVPLVTTPEFPEAYKPEALAGGRFLDLLRAEKELDWTFLSPSASFEPGRRTGTFRLGGDRLLVGEQGSRISFEDYAIALVDEIEKPAHHRQRFTVGY